MVVNGGVDISKKPVWIEGPHLYHINGKYYIMCAEGGTSVNHTEVVFSSDKPFGPFKPCKVNPILTQLGLPWDRPEPVTCAGHADLGLRLRNNRARFCNPLVIRRIAKCCVLHCKCGCVWI